MKVQVTSLLTLSILLGCASADNLSEASNKSLPQVQNTQAYEICLQESNAYDPRTTNLETEKSRPFNPDFTPNDNALISGGGFGGEILKAQQIKKNQDAKKKILADCLNKLGISK